MNMTQKLSLKDQILILNSKFPNYDVKHISSIIEIDLLILFTRRRALDTLIEKLINVVVEHPPSPSARTGAVPSGSQNRLPQNPYYSGVLLIGRRPDTNGLPTKSARRTAVRTQT
jgi:hypothetical protein